MTDRQIKIGTSRLAHPFINLLLIFFLSSSTARALDEESPSYVTAKGKGKWRTGSFHFMAASAYSLARGERGSYEPEAGMD